MSDRNSRIQDLSPWWTKIGYDDAIPSKPSFFKIVGVKLNSINFYIKMLNNEEVYMFKLGPFLI